MYLRATIVVSVALLALGVGVGFVGLPRLFRALIRKQINLQPGSDTRKIWEQAPFPLSFKVYAFNLTNPLATQNGGKPQLQQVGPFCFDEWKDKYNIVDNATEDAVSYNMRNTFHFRPDLCLSGEEVITMPHPLIQVMALSVKRANVALLPAVAQAIEALFQPGSAFITASFMDVFYRGFDISCAGDEFAANAVCLNLQAGAIRGAVKLNETHFKFSLMGASNHSDAGRFKVARGSQDSRLVGAVLAYNDNAGALDVWPGEPCNRLRGTDGTIFAPMLQPTAGLWAFTPDLCRSMSPKFVRVLSYAKLPAYLYAMDFGDVQHESEQYCYCNAHPQDCPAKGTLALGACTATPMIASLPHFLHGAAHLLDDVAGLQPDARQHGFEMQVEPLTGTMLVVNKRVQYSLDVEAVAAVPGMSQLRTLAMPLFWVEESLRLNRTFTEALRKKIFLPLEINNILKWISTALGSAGCVLALYMLQERRNAANRVTTHNESNTRNNDKF